MSGIFAEKSDPSIHSMVIDFPAGSVGRYIHIKIEGITGPVTIQEVMCYQDRRLLPGADYQIPDPSTDLQNVDMMSSDVFRPSNSILIDGAMLNIVQPHSYWKIYIDIYNRYTGTIIIFKQYDGNNYKLDITSGEVSTSTGSLWKTYFPANEDNYGAVGIYPCDATGSGIKTN